MVSLYEQVRFLYEHQSEVKRDDSTKEWMRVEEIKDPSALQYEKENKDRRKNNQG